LGFRLTAGYVLFFAVLLFLVGFGFRGMLVSIQENQLRDVLEEDWIALRSFFRATPGGYRWEYDPDDAQAVFILERLKRIFLLADGDGHVLELSPGYRVIGPEQPPEIRRMLDDGGPVWIVRSDPWGTGYMVRSGLFLNDGKRRYYVAIGRSQALHQGVVRQFTVQYFTVLPILLLIGGALGWLLIKRLMRPLQEVVRTSEAVTGDNLSLRIPLRGAGDELDRLSDTFNRMIERLEASFRQMRQFTADVSHELRTPITAVRGQLEVALLTSRSEQGLREAILAALDETERLANLVKAMLSLSQAESGQTVLHKRRQDLSALVLEVLDQFHFSAEEAGLRVVTSLPERCEAEVDRIQFDRLVSNLLSNALTHTPAGGEVRLSLQQDAAKVQLVVADTGRGIPAEHLPRIFDRFYRVPGMGSDSFKGMGLGLSFVAWIVRAHGGKIEVSSEVGRGTGFVVTLPRVASTSALPLGT
jgi:heavy metal sensor kinase